MITEPNRFLPPATFNRTPQALLQLSQGLSSLFIPEFSQFLNCIYCFSAPALYFIVFTSTIHCFYAFVTLLKMFLLACLNYINTVFYFDVVTHV